MNYTKSVVIPEENEYINFQNFQRIKKNLPLIISILVQTLKNIKIELFAVMAKNYGYR